MTDLDRDRACLLAAEETRAALTRADRAEAEVARLTVELAKVVEDLAMRTLDAQALAGEVERLRVGERAFVRSAGPGLGFATDEPPPGCSACPRRT